LSDSVWRRYTAASFLTRFPQPMSLLGFQLVGMQLTGKLSYGAILVGLSGLCGICGPLLGRWYDGGPTKQRLQLTAIVAACCLAGVALCGQLRAPFAILVPLVMVQGICLGGTWAGFRSLMNGVVPAARRTQAHYIESLMVEIGYAVGPLVVTAVALLWSTDGALWMMVASEAGGIFILRRLRFVQSSEVRPARRSSANGSSRSTVVRSVWLMCAMACASSFGFAVVESNVPSSMQGFGLSPSSAGLFMALLGGGSCLGGVGVSIWSARRQSVLLRGAILFAIFGIVSLPAAFAGTAWMYGLALPINSLPLVPLSGLCASEIEHAVGSDGRGKAFGMLNAATRLGGGCGAMLNGVLLTIVSASRIPLVSSADFLLVAAVLTVFVGARHVAAPNGAAAVVRQAGTDR
jgi:MFS family permease